MRRGMRSSGVVTRSEELVALEVVVVILNRPNQFVVKEFTGGYCCSIWSFRTACQCMQVLYQITDSR